MHFFSLRWQTLQQTNLCLCAMCLIPWNRIHRFSRLTSWSTKNVSFKKLHLTSAIKQQKISYWLNVFLITSWLFWTRSILLKLKDRQFSISRHIGLPLKCKKKISLPPSSHKTHVLLPIYSTLCICLLWHKLMSNCWFWDQLLFISLEISLLFFLPLSAGEWVNQSDEYLLYCQD